MIKITGKLLLLFLALAIAACCDARDDKKPEPSRTDLMPFTISFTLEGEPVLLGADGQPLEPTKLEYPLHATAIERIDSIVMVQAKGSHYKAIILNGKEYHIPLSH